MTMAGSVILDAGSPVRRVQVAGHTLDVFTEWPEYAARLLPDIAGARKRVWVEVYIFHNDTAGQAVAAALIERAKAGLDVRLLVDYVGSQRTPDAFFGKLREAGVKFHNYHTFAEALWKFSIFGLFNRRNHRKLIVVDDNVGYFGGMNIIDAQDPPTAEEANHGMPNSAGWRDVHVRMQGPQTSDLAESYIRSWQRALKEKCPRKPRAYRRPRLADQTDSIRFFDSGPGGKYSRAARVFSALLKRAKERVTLSMAYFVPIGGVMRSLLRARRRGVRIRVIIPGKSDVRLVQRATTHLYKKLLDQGLRIYERQDRMLHSKVMVVDGKWTVVGSANFDPRSFFTNLEFLAVVRSGAFAAVIEEICREEMKGSKVVHLADCGKLSWTDRLLNQGAWSIRRWL